MKNSSSSGAVATVDLAVETGLAVAAALVKEPVVV